MEKHCEQMSLPKTEKEYLNYKICFCAKDGNLIKLELKMLMICISVKIFSMTSDLP